VQKATGWPESAANAPSPVALTPGRECPDRTPSAGDQGRGAEAPQIEIVLVGRVGNGVPGAGLLADGIVRLEIDLFDVALGFIGGGGIGRLVDDLQPVLPRTVFVALEQA